MGPPIFLYFRSNFQFIILLYFLGDFFIFIVSCDFFHFCYHNVLLCSLYVSFSYFMDVISSLFPLRILIIVWGVLLVNSYFLSSSLFLSCFFWSWMFTLDAFFQCLAYLLWLNCQLTALRWGLWIRSFPQGDVVRQYPERNAGIPIFPLKLVRFPRYDSFNLLPGKIYALLFIF